MMAVVVPASRIRSIAGVVLTALTMAVVFYGIAAFGPHLVHAHNPYRIVIDIPAHRLQLIDGNRVVDTYPVAVGKPNTPSPRGEFTIVQKAIWGDGFGTRWMRFSAPWGIYGIHGTDKPWTVGTVASHGCIRMFNRDVEQLYRVVPLGTPVILTGYTPYTAIRRPLVAGAIGQDVVEFERLLRLAKVYNGPLNGIYSPAVVQAVKLFQAEQHLDPTGAASLNVIKLLQEKTGQAGLTPRYLTLGPNLRKNTAG
jgi:hypothetical protein